MPGLEAVAMKGVVEVGYDNVVEEVWMVDQAASELIILMMMKRLDEWVEMMVELLKVVRKQR